MTTLSLLVSRCPSVLWVLWVLWAAAAAGVAIAIGESGEEDGAVVIATAGVVTAGVVGTHGVEIAGEAVHGGMIAIGIGVLATTGAGRYTSSLPLHRHHTKSIVSIRYTQRPCTLPNLHPSIAHFSQSLKYRRKKVNT